MYVYFSTYRINHNIIWLLIQLFVILNISFNALHWVVPHAVIHGLQLGHSNAYDLDSCIYFRVALSANRCDIWPNTIHIDPSRWRITPSDDRSPLPVHFPVCFSTENSNKLGHGAWSPLRCSLTLFGFKQQLTQYSYTEQHPSSMHESQSYCLDSGVNLQHPVPCSSVRGQTYPSSSTMSTLPWIEFRQLGGTTSFTVAFLESSRQMSGCSRL